MENLNKKMYRGFHIKLDSELDYQICRQLKKQMKDGKSQ